MKLVVETKIGTEEIAKVTEQLTKEEISKGAGIRALFAGGLDVKEISTVTGIRYNHVYNVVRNEVLVHSLEVENTGRNNENSKKNQILTQLAAGKTITEVSKELKCLYNYVWQIAKAAGYTNKQTQAANEAKPEAPTVEPKAAHKEHKKVSKEAVA